MAVKWVEQRDGVKRRAISAIAVLSEQEIAVLTRIAKAEGKTLKQKLSAMLTSFAEQEASECLLDEKWFMREEVRPLLNIPVELTHMRPSPPIVYSEE